MHLRSDNSAVQNDNVRLSPSTICKGKGVFSKRPLRRGQTITRYDGYLLNDNKKMSIEQEVYAYSFDDERIIIGNTVDASTSKGIAQFVNDAMCACITGKQSNCQFEENTLDHEVTLVANRFIHTGEEILVHYGWDYWSTKEFDEDKVAMVRFHVQLNNRMKNTYGVQVGEAKSHQIEKTNRGTFIHTLSFAAYGAYVDTDAQMNIKCWVGWKNCTKKTE